MAMAKSAVELLFFMDKTENIRQKAYFCGLEHLQQALGYGKGVILVSAHFGNFPLMLTRLRLEGFPTAAIMRPMRDQRVERMFVKQR